jgi:chromosomal replication initiator protein
MAKWKPARPWRVQHILELVADHYAIDDPELLVSPARWQPLARARQVAMTLVREELEYSLPAAGRVFKRDHTTVLHGLRAVQADPEAVEALAKLRELVRFTPDPSTAL